jgi:putative ABC transport system ATP-binding protein
VIVSLADVRRDYPIGADRVHALQGVSLDVEQGDYIAIVGPSGCGKSTLLNLIGVIDHPTSGTVTIAGKRVDAMTDREATLFRLHNIGFVFQRFYLMPILSALENVALPMAESKVPAAERKKRAAELLTYVGLGARLNHRPS